MSGVFRNFILKTAFYSIFNIFQLKRDKFASFFKLDINFYTSK